MPSTDAIRDVPDGRNHRAHCRSLPDRGCEAGPQELVKNHGPSVVLGWSIKSVGHQISFIASSIEILGHIECKSFESSPSPVMDHTVRIPDSSRSFHPDNYPKSACHLSSRSDTYYTAFIPNMTCHRNSITLPLWASFFPVVVTQSLKTS